MDSDIGQTPEQTTGNSDQTTAPQPAGDAINAEQLISYLRKAHFEGTRGRRGHHIGEVNAFLNLLVEAVQEGEPLADLVRRQKFTTVRLEHGYDIGQVDAFLAAAVDLDPHARAARPSVGRSGLITKLFG